MRITTRGEYGLRCILYVARHSRDGIVSIREIARGEHLPKDYVEQLLLRLRRAGLIESIRGMHGGYRLAKEPSGITVKDVIEALEKGTFNEVCHKYIKGSKRCVHLKRCGLSMVWKRLKDSIDDVLREANLKYILDKERSHEAENDG